MTPPLDELRARIATAIFQRTLVDPFPYPKDLADAVLAVLGEPEQHSERRLTGQPNGAYPFYEHTANDGTWQCDAIQRIAANIAAGRYAWTGVEVHARDVIVFRQQWTPIDLAEFGQRAMQP